MVTGGSFLQALIYPLRGLMPLALLGLLALVPFGSLLGYPLIVLWSLLVIRESVRGGRGFPHFGALRGTPDLLPLWGRGLLATGLILAPIWLLLAGHFASRLLPEDALLEKALTVLVPLGALAGFVLVGFLPGALTLAALDPDHKRLLSWGAIRGRVGDIWPTLPVTVFGVFFLLIATGLLSEWLGSPWGRVANLLLLAWWQLVFARVAGLCLAPGA